MLEHQVTADLWCAQHQFQRIGKLRLRVGRKIFLKLIINGIGTDLLEVPVELRDPPIHVGNDEVEVPRFHHKIRYETFDIIRANQGLIGDMGDGSNLNKKFYIKKMRASRIIYQKTG